MILDRVTIEGNSADVGGGINVGNGASATLTNVTMSGNTAIEHGWCHFDPRHCRHRPTRRSRVTPRGRGRSHTQGAGSATLKNTILSDNAGGNASGASTSLGNNIDSANTAGLTGPGDRINT